MLIKTKALIIQITIVIVSMLLTLTLAKVFEIKGLINLIPFCSLIPFSPIGLYIIFGKYVYLHGVILTKTKKIIWGLFFLLSMPIIWFIKELIKFQPN